MEPIDRTNRAGSVQPPDNRDGNGIVTRSGSRHRTNRGRSQPPPGNSESGSTLRTYRGGSQQRSDERNDERQSIFRSNRSRSQQPQNNRDENGGCNTAAIGINEEEPHKPKIQMLSPIEVDVQYYPHGHEPMDNQEGRKLWLIPEDKESSGVPSTPKIIPKPDSPNSRYVTPVRQLHDKTDLTELILGEVCARNSLFQYRIILLFGFTLALSGAFGLAFVLTAFDVEQR